MAGSMQESDMRISTTTDMKRRTFKKILAGLAGAVILFVLVVVVNLLIVNKDQEKISQGKRIKEYEDPQPALLIIDIQEATTGEYSLYPFFRSNAENLLLNLNRAIDNFNQHQLPVIYVKSEITNPLINLINNSYAKGSASADFDRRLNLVSDLLVSKKVKDAFRNTPLDSLLMSNRVNEIYVAGVDAAECVNATVQAALNRGYKIHILKDAALSKSQAATDSMMLVFNRMGTSVIITDSLVHHLGLGHSGKFQPVPE